MANLTEIMRMTPTERYNAYRAEDIKQVTINGVEFTNYKAFHFIWEKSYKVEPERTEDGSIEGLNDYEVIITAHFSIDFSLLSIDEYRKLIKLYLSTNEFAVECYDPIYNQKITENMYFTPQEMAQLYIVAGYLDGTNTVELLGVEGLTVEMIGTNTSASASITYHLNPPPATGQSDTTYISNVDIFKPNAIGAGCDYPSQTFSNTYAFTYWTVAADGSGLKYNNGLEYYINETSLTLYANWEAHP